MGNKKSKKAPNIYDRIENLLYKTYKNTGLEFTDNEITNFKLRIMDSERYFNSNFDYFIFFNNYLFKEQLSILYENFNQIIEVANKNPEKPLCILVDFDDESDYIFQGFNIEFDSLFTIIFEKLEIPILIFFDMTNTDSIYIFDFFKQIIENVELYKYNRKFDCLYFLLPNTDYFSKNENALYYISNKAFNDDEEITDDMFDVVNEYSDSVFLHEDIEKFINCSYPKNISNNRFEKMLNRINPNFIKMFICFNFDLEFDVLHSLNSENLEKIEFILNNCERNNIVINFCYSLNSNNLNNFEKIIIGNISYILKQICFIFFKIKSTQSILGIKINLKIKEEDEISNLIKLSSRNYDYINNAHNSTRKEMKSKREKEKEKIHNYFYDSQYNNIFEILTFDISTILNNFVEFPLISEEKEIKPKKDNRRLSEFYEYTYNQMVSSSNKNDKKISVGINNLKGFKKDDKKNANNDNDTINNKNKLNSLPSEIIDYEKKHSNDYCASLSNDKNKSRKLFKKLNIEFNEISPVNKENVEIVKYFSSSDQVGKEEQKVIKLDHNLHSEKLLLNWEDPIKKTKQEIDSIKKRNKEFNNFKNLMNNCNLFSSLREWNILISLQNMFIEDIASKSYKIEKSNINFIDYMQKLH